MSAYDGWKSSSDRTLWVDYDYTLHRNTLKFCLWLKKQPRMGFWKRLFGFRLSWMDEGAEALWFRARNYPNPLNAIVSREYLRVTGRDFTSFEYFRSYPKS